MSGFWEALFQEEEEKNDLLSIVLRWLSFVAEAPSVLFSILFGLLMSSKEVLCDYGIQAADMIALKEWWSVEHTAMLFCLAGMLPSSYKKNNGDLRKTSLQLLSGLAGIAWIGVFMNLALGLQGGMVFDGKLVFPTLFLLSIVIEGMFINFTLLMKELHGYGVEDRPRDAKTAELCDTYKKMAFFESAFLMALATFGLPELDSGTEDLRSWLVVLPTLGFFKELRSSSSKGKAEEVDPTDANGIPPQLEADKNEETKNEEKNEEKKEEEKVEKKEEKIVDQEESKTAIEQAAAKPLWFGQFRTGVIQNLIGKLEGIGNLFGSYVCLGVDRLMRLPWDSVFQTVSILGTNYLICLTFWVLTDDLACLAFPFLNVGFPFLLDKAKARKWLTDSKAHVVSQAFNLALVLNQYYLFQTHISKPI